MKIYLGCDHAAFEAKEEVKKILSQHDVEDLGAHGSERVNYPDFAKSVCEGVVTHDESRGILLCGSGIGMSMTANRFAGIRAALCRTLEEAELSRQHNDANVLCLGARTTDLNLLKQIVEKWLTTDFEEGRHTDRIALFNDLGTKLS